jgi:hypothetical protein
MLRDIVAGGQEKRRSLPFRAVLSGESGQALPVLELRPVMTAHGRPGEVVIDVDMVKERVTALAVPQGRVPLKPVGHIDNRIDVSAQTTVLDASAIGPDGRR